MLYNLGCPVIHHDPITRTTTEKTTALHPDHYLATYAVFWPGNMMATLISVVYESEENFQKYGETFTQSGRVRRFLGQPDSIFLWLHHHVDDTMPSYIILFI